MRSPAREGACERPSYGEGGGGACVAFCRA